jgi:hypothetical protein
VFGVSSAATFAIGAVPVAAIGLALSFGLEERPLRTATATPERSPARP